MGDRQNMSVFGTYFDGVYADLNDLCTRRVWNYLGGVFSNDVVSVEEIKRQDQMIKSLNEKIIAKDEEISKLGAHNEELHNDMKEKIADKDRMINLLADYVEELKEKSRTDELRNQVILEDVEKLRRENARLESELNGIMENRREAEREEENARVEQEMMENRRSEERERYMRRMFDAVKHYNAMTRQNEEQRENNNEHVPDF